MPMTPAILPGQPRKPSKTRAGILALVVPVLGLTLLAVMAALYVGNYEWYLHVFYGVGFVPWKYPFLDWEGVTSAIQCWQQGIDVYRVNPCDILGRPHAYSPLWLRATFLPGGPVWRNITGLSLAMAFFASLAAIMRPRSWAEVLLFALAAFSTATVYVLERANIDLVIFLLLVAAGLLGTGGVRSRLVSYALILFAGLLKFYPLAVLLCTMRERPRLFAVLAALSFCIIAIAYLGYRNEFEGAVGVIAHGGFDSVFFGASNLPTGLAYYLTGHPLFPNQAMAPAAASGAIRSAFFALLSLGVVVQAAWLGRSAGLVRAFAQTPDRESLFLVIGALLILACFFAGQNIAYRGVFFVFVVPGLVAMRRHAAAPATRRALLGLIFVVLFLMWSDAVHHWFAKIAGTSAMTAFWLARELLWWQLAAALAALILIFTSHSSAIVGARSWLAGPRPASS